jgi:hypothetical protein
MHAETLRGRGTLSEALWGWSRSLERFGVWGCILEHSKSGDAFWDILGSGDTFGHSKKWGSHSVALWGCGHAGVGRAHLGTLGLGTHSGTLWAL